MMIDCNRAKEDNTEAFLEIKEKTMMN